jgi:hypothetical protein
MDNYDDLTSEQVRFAVCHRRGWEIRATDNNLFVAVSPDGKRDTFEAATSVVAKRIGFPRYSESMDDAWVLFYELPYAALSIDLQGIACVYAVVSPEHGIVYSQKLSPAMAISIVWLRYCDIVGV